MSFLFSAKSLNAEKKEPEKKASPPSSPRHSSGGKARNKRRFLTSKAWLAKHGLLAERLTFLDALRDAVQRDSEKRNTINKEDLQKISKMPVAVRSSGMSPN